jgi:hypothetical protein
VFLEDSEEFKSHGVRAVTSVVADFSRRKELAGMERWRSLWESFARRHSKLGENRCISVNAALYESWKSG